MARSGSPRRRTRTTCSSSRPIAWENRWSPGDTLGNGLQRYTNGAWTPASSGVTPYSFVRSVALNPRSGKLYLANNNNSGNGFVFTSADDGQTWQSFSSGLPNTGMNYLAFAPDGTLYLVTRDGRFYRTAGAVP